MMLPIKHSLSQRMGQVWKKHIQTHSSLYLFTIILFSMGIIFGTLTVQSLGYEQQNQLFTYFQQFVQEMNQEVFVEHGHAFVQNFFHYLKYIGFIWVLGLSIIGLPLILVMIFLKGVFIGFTVGFLVHQMGWQGVFIALVGVVPQNMIVVPLMLVVGVLSMSFSFQLIGHLFRTKTVYTPINFSKYMLVIVVVTFVLIFVSFFQTYLSPVLINFVT